MATSCSNLDKSTATVTVEMANQETQTARQQATPSLTAFATGNHNDGEFDNATVFELPARQNTRITNTIGSTIDEGDEYLRHERALATERIVLGLVRLYNRAEQGWGLFEDEQVEGDEALPELESFSATTSTSGPAVPPKRLLLLSLARSSTRSRTKGLTPTATSVWTRTRKRTSSSNCLAATSTMRRASRHGSRSARPARSVELW